jgi:ribonuclease T2
MLRRTARFSLIRFIRIGLSGIALSGAVFALSLSTATAQDRSATSGSAVVAASAAAAAGQNEPGKFEFYLLALSWSPSFCEASRERASSNRRSDPQCEARPYSFVVHGLWPQHERGFPSNCKVPAPRLPRAIVDSMLELMPSPRLVFHEWDRHGTCTGLSSADYFDTVRKARAAIKIPAEYQSIAEPVTVTPAQVADAFVRVNPGLPRDALTIACDGKRLTGVRVCMSKDLAFRDCAEIAKRSCQAGSVVMLPVRGARAADSSLH